MLNPITIPNQSELNSRKVPELHKMVKATGTPYKIYSKMKKAEAITHILKYKEEQHSEVDIEPKSISHDDIAKQTEEFLSKGGKIKEGPPPRDPKLEVTSQRTALTSARKPVKKSIRKKTVAKAKSKPHSETITDGVSLKGICEELGVAPTKARKILRAEKIAKPGKQWVWEKGSSEIESIKSLIKGAK